MYKSPIEINMFPMEPTYRTFQEEINGHLETRVTATIQEKYHIDCDKDELIKALQYDRQQYDKGYADAKKTYQITANTANGMTKKQLIEDLMTITEFFRKMNNGASPLCLTTVLEILEKIDIPEGEQQ